MLKFSNIAENQTILQLWKVTLETGASSTRICPATSLLLLIHPSTLPAAASDGNQHKNMLLLFQSLPPEKLEAIHSYSIPQRHLICLFLSSASEEHAITALLVPQLSPCSPGSPCSRRGFAAHCTAAAPLCHAFAVDGPLLPFQMYSCFLLHLKTPNCRACISQHRHAGSPEQSIWKLSASHEMFSPVLLWQMWLITAPQLSALSNISVRKSPILNLL